MFWDFRSGKALLGRCKIFFLLFLIVWIELIVGKSIKVLLEVPGENTVLS